MLFTSTSTMKQVLHVLGVIMAQTYSIKNGIKEFGERGSESVMKELRGIDDLDTFFPTFFTIFNGDCAFLIPL